MALLVIGGLLSIIGFLLCLTVIGAVIGIPLIILGSVLMLVGMIGRRKTVITNVVTVQQGPVDSEPRSTTHKSSTS